MAPSPGDSGNPAADQNVGWHRNAGAGLRAGSYALIEVSDNGCGMSETVRAQAFDPFFTTRERGHGTGLGLSTVQGFAHQLGGTVEIDSIPGQGTTVRLSLPLSKQA